MGYKTVRLVRATEVRMSHSEFVVLWYLADVVNDESGLCCPKQETIARDCRMSVRAVQNALRGLRKSGVVAVQRDGYVNHYCLNMSLLTGVIHTHDVRVHPHEVRVLPAADAGPPAAGAYYKKNLTITEQQLKQVPGSFDIFGTPKEGNPGMKLEDVKDTLAEKKKTAPLKNASAVSLLWRQTIHDHFPDKFVPAATAKELGIFGQLLKRADAERLRPAIEVVVANWYAFTEYVTADAKEGSKNTGPQRPNIDYFVKYLEQALNFSPEAGYKPKSAAEFFGSSADEKP